MALGAGGVLLSAIASRGATMIRWSLVGWAIMGLIGVAGGSWMAAVHGRPGNVFLAALVGCILSRLVACAVGAVAATSMGYKAAWPYVIGRRRCTSGRSPGGSYTHDSSAPSGSPD